MPEGPEVEVVKQSLTKLILNHTIKEVIVNHPPIVSNDLEFETKLIGQKFLEIKRKGKFLIFILTNNVLISHLRMEGKYQYQKSTNQYRKHDYVIFKLDNGYDLIFNDTRKFGRFILQSFNYETIEPIINVAEAPETIDPNILFQKFSKTNRAIKEVLLDQRIISEIGNIYASEILYHCQIHPTMPAKLVTLTQTKKIIEVATKVLSDSIKHGGSTVDSYESMVGTIGTYQNELKVYGKQGQPCANEGIVYKFQLKGRGTYACSSLQKHYIIGITGGVATGKSTMVTYLREKGYEVIDSDEIVRKIYQTPYHINQISSLLKMPLVNNELDKKQIAELVFNDQEKLKQLDGYVHPVVFEEIEKLKQLSEHYFIFIEMPLLFETNYQVNCDQVIVIDAAVETQIERLIKRNHYSEALAKQVVNNQLGRIEKIKLADIVISNNKDYESFIEEINNYLLTNFKGK